ncbi:MAG: PorT family protein [Saprospiraceae bacterium]|nr:PorT family protein [Saprospiraceae bacterium]
MNRKMLIVLCIVLYFPFIGIGQNIGITSGFGISRFNLRQENFPTYISQYETFKHYPVWSTSVGIDSKFDLSKNLSSTFGLSYSKKGNREYTVYHPIQSNNPDTTWETIINNSLHFHYLDLKALINIKKINVFVGCQLSYLWFANSSGYYQVTEYHNGIEYNSDKQEQKNTIDLRKIKAYSRIDLGLVLGYSYEINSRAELTLTYCQGFIGVLQNDLFINYKNSQLLFGLRYALTQEKDK